MCVVTRYEGVPIWRYAGTHHRYLYVQHMEEGMVAIEMAATDECNTYLRSEPKIAAP